MATYTNDEKFLQEGEFFPISIVSPMAYEDNNTYYNPWLRIAYKGAIGDRWREMVKRYGDNDVYNDMYLQIGNKYIRINPQFLTPGKKRNEWAKYTYVDENGATQTVDLNDLNVFYRRNPGLGAASTPTTTTAPSTSVPTGSYFHLNDRTAPVIAPNYGAYTYSEWMNTENPWARNVENIRSLGNIYGDIDTAEELGILAQLQGAQGAMDYINNQSKKELFKDRRFVGDANDVRTAATLLGKYATTDEGKPFNEQLRRGYASIDNMNRYAAYDAARNWQDQSDKNYLNQSLNSRDKMYRGAQFFRKYAGDKTWGNLANQFASNNRFRDDHYTVDEKHIMDRLNRDAGLGNGRKLIDIYNDIINNSPNITDEQAYALFRDMTRRRFKIDNDFWNRHAKYLSGIRNKVIGADEVLFKNGGQIFRMLFV